MMSHCPDIPEATEDGPPAVPQKKRVEIQSSQQARKRNRFTWQYYCWFIVLLCTLSRLAKVPGQSNFLAYSVPELQQEFRLSYTEMGTEYSNATLAASLLQPLLGYLFDRFGARVCISISHVLLVAALLYMSVLVAHASRLVNYFAIVSVFFSLRALSMGALEIYSFACVQEWFDKRRGRAIALMCFLGGIGQSGLSPVGAWLVEDLGWRMWSKISAVFNLGMALGAAVLLRSGPQACGAGLDGAAPLDLASDVAEPLADLEEAEVAGGGADEATVSAELKGASDEASPAHTNFRLSQALSINVVLVLMWTLLFGIVLGGVDFDMLGMIEEAGADAPSYVASLAFMAITGSTAFTVPLLGILSDRFYGSVKFMLVFLMLGSFILAATLVMLTVSGTSTMVVLYGLLRGLSHGVEQALIGSGTCFLVLGVRKEGLGRMLGINAFVKLAGTGLGPLFYGICRDKMGEFRTSLIISALPIVALSIAFAVRLMAHSPVSCRRMCAVLHGYATMKGGSELPRGPSWLFLGSLFDVAEENEDKEEEEKEDGSLETENHEESHDVQNISAAISQSKVPEATAAAHTASAAETHAGVGHS